MLHKSCVCVYNMSRLAHQRWQLTVTNFCRISQNSRKRHLHQCTILHINTIYEKNKKLCQLTPKLVHCMDPLNIHSQATTCSGCKAASANHARHTDTSGANVLWADLERYNSKCQQPPTKILYKATQNIHTKTPASQDDTTTTYAHQVEILFSSNQPLWGSGPRSHRSISSGLDGTPPRE